MPEPNGTITINGNFKKAKECERGNAAFAEAVLHADELADMKKEAGTSQLLGAAAPAKLKNTFKSSVETKQMDLVKGDSSKQVTIGSGLDDK